MYFLTGEHQVYDRHEGVFGRVVPNHNYHWNKNDCYGACGAGNLAGLARFSYLDLNDKGIQGGEVYDWTFGLNWYLNPSMKFQLNYIAERRDMPGAAVGWINGVGLRGVLRLLTGPAPGSGRPRSGIARASQVLLRHRRAGGIALAGHGNVARSSSRAASR